MKIGSGEYKKNRTDMYQVLRSFMDFVIANAKRLDEINDGKMPSKAAPGTKVYELLEVLKPYLPEEWVGLHGVPSTIGKGKRKSL